MSQMLTEILLKYDLYHCSVVAGGNAKLNIIYNNDLVKVSLIKTYNGNFSNIEYSFKNDDEFETILLPKLLVRFFTKNVSVETTVTMIDKNIGTCIVKSTDESEELIVENCSSKIIEMINGFSESQKRLNATPVFSKNLVPILNEDDYFKYLKSNVALLYAVYRKNFMDKYGKSNFYNSNTRKSFLDEENRDNERNLENLVILDLARHAIKIGFSDDNSYNIWDELKSLYSDDLYIASLCEKYKTINFDEYNVFVEALICADYEMCNEGFIYENPKIIEEAIIAIKNNVYDGVNNYKNYFNARMRYYGLLKNSELESICNDFLNSDSLILMGVSDMDKKRENFYKSSSVLNKIIELKDNSRPDFSTMINEPLVVKEEFSSGSTFEADDKDAIVHDAEEQAKKIMEILKERDQIKKDAEEFAKIIIKEQKERRKLIKDAEEFAKIIAKEQEEREKLELAAQKQAELILKLQQENDLLKSLAEDNARSIFARELKRNESLKLREVAVDTPVKNSDIERINALLNALNNVKELDFAISHPTVLEVIYNLEDKIVTYLVTHKNIVSDSVNKEETKITSFEENKTPTELVELIRKVYASSRVFENHDQHTLINVFLTEDKKYGVTLYTISGSHEDLLTEVYFNEKDFTEDIIKDICNIYSKDVTIVASKTDNIPGNKCDYLVVDDRNNAIKFVGCSKEIIEIVKAYL